MNKRQRSAEARRMLEGAEDGQRVHFTDGDDNTFGYEQRGGKGVALDDVVDETAAVDEAAETVDVDGGA